MTPTSLLHTESRRTPHCAHSQSQQISTHRHTHLSVLTWEGPYSGRQTGCGRQSMSQHSFPSFPRNRWILWLPWDSVSNMCNLHWWKKILPFSSVLSGFVFFIHCALWRELTIPPSNPFEKGGQKKNREMRAANPFFIPLVVLNKRRMCRLSLTEGIKSSGLSHALNALLCRAEIDRESTWREQQQQRPAA